MNLLIIMGPDYFRDNLRELLEMDGYQVELIDNSSIAIHTIKKDKALDAIICDGLNQSMDGKAIFPLLDHSLPLIVLNEAGEPDDEWPFGTCFLQQPVQFDLLKDVLINLKGNRTLQD